MNATMNTTHSTRPLALVTGASSGIGYELAQCCVDHGYDLLIAADEPQIELAAMQLRQRGASVEAVQADLSTTEGVEKVIEAVRSRPVEALLANAGHGLGDNFFDQDWQAARKVVDTNVVGTLAMVQAIGRRMRQRGRGRILITGSIAGFMPGSLQAVYDGSTAFLDSFAHALADELKGRGVTVTCLMPGATHTRFFDRAGLRDSKLGTMKKGDPASVARAGFEAMQAGKPGVVTGVKNKLQTGVARFRRAPLLARMQRRQAAPGTAWDAPASTALRQRGVAKPIGLLIVGVAITALVLAAWPRRRTIAKRTRRLVQHSVGHGLVGARELAAATSQAAREGLGHASRSVQQAGATLLH